MNGRLRPAPVVIRAWFFLFGIVLLICVVTLYDVSIVPLADADGNEQGFSSLSLH